MLWFWLQDYRIFWLYFNSCFLVRNDFEVIFYCWGSRFNYWFFWVMLIIFFFFIIWEIWFWLFYFYNPWFKFWKHCLKIINFFYFWVMINVQKNYLFIEKIDRFVYWQLFKFFIIVIYCHCYFRFCWGLIGVILFLVRWMRFSGNWGGWHWSRLGNLLCRRCWTCF